MNIAIIGAGFTGLSAAFQLQKQGHTVTIFEKDSQPGGLAIGYQEKEWKWSLEKHYHHWFTNDTFVLNIAKEINHHVYIKRPKTSVFVNNAIYQLDSPSAFLSFPLLPFTDRLRMTLALGLLRINPFWKPLEKIHAVPILQKTMGEKAWNLLWKPQLVNKMGAYASDISLVWFWTRINKRTPSLAYPEGGFLSFATHLADEITKRGGKIYYDVDVTEIKDKNRNVELMSINAAQPQSDKDRPRSNQRHIFDSVIVTLPSYLFVQIAPQLSETYKQSLSKLRGIGATNMIIRMNKQFMKDNTYWLSICEDNSPVLVIVEHTNLLDAKNYNNEHIIYVGNYLDPKDTLFYMDKKELLHRYDALLRRINPDYAKYIIDFTVFRAPFAQPIIPTNYSKIIPKMTTPLPHVFLANIEQVYPWDRGTNYAVELGEKVANLITDN